MGISIVSNRAHKPMMMMAGAGSTGSGAKTCRSLLMNIHLRVSSSVAEMAPMKNQQNQFHVSWDPLLFGTDRVLDGICVEYGGSMLKSFKNPYIKQPTTAESVKWHKVTVSHASTRPNAVWHICLASLEDSNELVDVQNYFPLNKTLVVAQWYAKNHTEGAICAIFQGTQQLHTSHASQTSHTSHNPLNSPRFLSKSSWRNPPFI